MVSFLLLIAVTKSENPNKVPKSKYNKTCTWHLEENYKTSLKDTEDLNKWKDVFTNRNIHCHKDVSSLQINQQRQCNSKPKGFGYKAKEKV